MRKRPINWVLWVFITIIVLSLVSCLYRGIEACHWDAQKKRAAGLQPACEPWR